MTRLLLALSLSSLVLLFATACPAGQPVQKVNPERVVATVGTEPIYAVEVDRLVGDELKGIRNSSGIFARPSPEELALLKEAKLHILLLNAVYKQPTVRFSKTRAIEYTRELTLEKARKVRAALLEGKPTQEVADEFLTGIYREPAQLQVDLLSTGQIQPAYKAEVFSTPVGEITDIIEDPSGGYYILRIVSKETVDATTERVQADSFFVSWDKEAGRQRVKEEDLAQSSVTILDPTLKALSALRAASDARTAGDAVTEQTKLAEARASLEADSKAWEKTADGQFLMAWIFELQARDPSSGATFEQALAHYQNAAEIQEKSAPGDAAYGFYIARIGEIQERLGQTAEAQASYRKALDAAKDNMDLTLALRAHFEQLSDQEYLAKADAEITRMGTASSYGKLDVGQKVLRTPGRMAEGVKGDSELFEIESVSQVVEGE